MKNSSKHSAMIAIKPRNPSTTTNYSFDGYNQFFMKERNTLVLGSSSASVAGGGIDDGGAWPIKTCQELG